MTSPGSPGPRPESSRSNPVGPNPAGPNPGGSGRHRRLFVAAWPDAGARGELERILERLRRFDGDVRWAPPGNLHVTLQFLGDVPDVRGEELTELLARATRPAAPFAWRLSGLGTFPARGDVRVVWTGVAEGARELAALASRLERELAAHAFVRPSDRPFRAHLTLGRPRSPRDHGALRDLLRELRFEGSERFLEEVTLVESLLSPRGAEYRVVARLPLATPPEDRRRAS
ncbi:MAG: RNA 2',3'-cyclic phosphodiesterase [bacterium]